MDREYRRRGVLGAGVAGSALPSTRRYLDRFAPHSGTAWRQAVDAPDGCVESTHGEATVAYDDLGVPHVFGATEAATYFAAGYAQAVDRRFQMDLSRRLMRGRLSAVAGEAAVESDRFHVQREFAGPAAATWEALAGTETGAMVEAYADGATAAIEREPTPHEAALLEYALDPWSPVDTLLVEKQIAWALTGSFRTLRKALVHWLGVFVGGALVGVLSDTWRRAALVGLTFGVLVWLAFAARLAVTGGLGTYLASGQLLLVSVAVATGLGTFGGLARALVP